MTEHLAELEEALIAYIHKTLPKAESKPKYGGTVFSMPGGKDFGGVFRYKAHVSVEFGQGHKLSDPDGLLEGSGQYRRHLKCRPDGEVPYKQLKAWLQAAAAKG